MLTYEECLAMSELSEEEIQSLAAHGRLSPIIAMALGQYLLTHGGHAHIQEIIARDIEAARKARDHERVILLQTALRQLGAWEAPTMDKKLTG